MKKFNIRPPQRKIILYTMCSFDNGYSLFGDTYWRNLMVPLNGAT